MTLVYISFWKKEFYKSDLEWQKDVKKEKLVKLKKKDEDENDEQVLILTSDLRCHLTQSRLNLATLRAIFSMITYPE